MYLVEISNTMVAKSHTISTLKDLSSVDEGNRMKGSTESRSSEEREYVVRKANAS